MVHGIGVPNHSIAWESNSMTTYHDLNPQGYYVYQYIDPRNNLPFYIGKGKKKRYLRHLFETHENTENKKKWAYIQGLRNKNIEPLIEIVVDNLTEQDAIKLEDTLIHQYGRKDLDPDGILTNICFGINPPRHEWDDERRNKQSEIIKNITNERKHGGKYEDGYNRLKDSQSRMIAEGTHNFVGKNNPNHARVANGTHHWQTTHSNEARLANGTHPSQIILTCPHCNLSGSLANMKRWHFDNCKISEKIEKEKERIANKILTCPHCGLTGRNTNLRRYHFENCKNKTNLRCE